MSLTDQLEAIQELRTKTRLLIKDLYDAATDKETFESLVDPIPQVKPEPPDYHSADTPNDYHQKTAIKVPRQPVRIKPALSKDQKHKIETRFKLKNVNLLEESEEFFKEMRDFRNLYPVEFNTTIADRRDDFDSSGKATPIGTKAYKNGNPSPAGKQDESKKDEEVVTGYYIVDKKLKICKSQQPFLFTPSVQPSKVKVSIPKSSLVELRKSIKLYTKSTYNPEDSVDIYHYLHKGYKERDRRKFKRGVSLEHECVLGLREKGLNVFDHDAQPIILE